MDRIKIQNLEVFGHHGVFSEETKLGQKFLVNATMYTNTRAAGYSDDLEKSINYGEVCHFITGYMQNHTFKLIEAVAEHMAQAMLMEYPLLQKLDLEIRKPWAPIGLPLENVSVEISRGWHTVYLSAGSNLGERQQFLRAAVRLLQECSEIRNLKVSKLMETAPYGYTEQPAFLNGAIELETLFTPQELLIVIHKIEAELGRLNIEKRTPLFLRNVHRRKAIVEKQIAGKRKAGADAAAELALLDGYNGILEGEHEIT